MAIKIIAPRDVEVTIEELQEYKAELNERVDNGWYIGGNIPTLEEFIREQQKWQKQNTI